MCDLCNRIELAEDKFDKGFKILSGEVISLRSSVNAQAKLLVELNTTLKSIDKNQERSRKESREDKKTMWDSIAAKEDKVENKEDKKLMKDDIKDLQAARNKYIGIAIGVSGSISLVGWAVTKAIG